MNERLVQIARSVAVIGGTGALIFGVTYAAVGDVSNASLAGNTLSVSAALQIAPDAAGVPGSYLTSAPGFNATTTNMRFGFERAAGDFWLKNTATGDQTVVVSIPGAPVLTGIAADKVHVHIKQGATEQLDTTLDQLQPPSTGVVLNKPLSPGAGSKYSLSYTIDKPTGGGVTANVGTFDLNFTGTEL